MLDALACRGPDSAGIALIGPPPEAGLEDVWSIRITPADDRRARSVEADRRARAFACRWDLARDRPGTHCDSASARRPGSRRSTWNEHSVPAGGAWKFSASDRGSTWSSKSGSPAQLEAAYGVSNWKGPMAIGHTRMSTESRIDLSHSQPFWVHGVPDLATVHNGHVTNYHQLRRRYEQKGVTFYTDNDSEVIGVYLRERMLEGLSPRRGA